MTVQDMIPMYQAPDYVVLPVEKEVCAEPEAQPPLTPVARGIRLLMAASFAVMIYLNVITGPKNPVVSNAYPTRIDPAGYAFSIWTPIFLGIGAFIVYTFTNHGPTNPLPKGAVIAFIANALCNGAWGWVFTHEYALLSVVVILGILASCAYMYMFVNPRGNSAFPELTVLYWCRRFVWSAYLSWNFVATLVNIEWAQQFYKVAIGDKAQNIEAVVIIAIAVVVAIYWTSRQDVVAISVFLWAFIAIIVKQGAQYPVVLISCLIGSVLLVCLGIVAVVRRIINGPKH